MKKLFILILLLWKTLPLYPQQPVHTIELTTTEKILGLSRIWEGVRNNFVYYDQLKFSWDSLYSASIQKVLDTNDGYSYIKELERIISTVKDGHTFLMHGITPPWNERFNSAPFTTKFIDGKVYVDTVWHSDLVKNGVKRGVQIITIEDMDVIKYGEEILGQYISSSTQQWLDYKVFNNYELTRGKFTVPIKIEFNDGEKNFTMNIARDMQLEIHDKERNSGELDEDEYSTFKYVTLQNEIGYLTIGDFMNDSFTQIFDSLYSEILNSKALIIDLRNNGGGRSNNVDYIIRHFSSKPIKTSSWSSRMYIPAHASWNYPSEWYSSASKYLSPVKEKKIYENPIMVLINSGTFSSAENFCVLLKEMNRGKLIGTPTGGSSGNGVQITLIDGIIKANICSKKDISSDGSTFVGKGVIPDIEVKESLESFLERKDVALENAISELTKK